MLRARTTGTREATAGPGAAPSASAEASEPAGAEADAATGPELRTEDAGVAVAAPAASPASIRPAKPWRPPPPPRPAATPDCSNPYVLDANGHRRYRRECLQR